MKTAFSFLFCALMTWAVAAGCEPAAAQAVVPADYNMLCKVFGYVALFVLGSLAVSLFLGGVLKRNQPEDCGECDQEPDLTNPDDLMDSRKMAEKRDKMRQSLGEYFKSQATVRGTAGSHKPEQRGATPRPATNLGLSGAEQCAAPCESVKPSSVRAESSSLPITDGMVAPREKPLTPDKHNRFPNGRWS